MISLKDYIAKLKDYKKGIDLELQEILKDAELNFKYKSIKITSFDYYDEENYRIKLLIKGYNDKDKDEFMEINCRSGSLDTLTYQSSNLYSGLMFENAIIDKGTLSNIALLALKHKSFYQNELSYDNIVRSMRHLPSCLPILDKNLTKEENEILDGTMLEEERLPKFLFEHKKTRKAKK